MATQNSDPPQPAGQGEYPINALRPSYIREFNNQSEAVAAGMSVSWNPNLPLKRWVDTRKAASALIPYNTAHLDASFQHPITVEVQVPSYLAGMLNIPPDSGQYTPSTQGEMLVPIRDLLPNEKLVPRQMGLFDVVNTSIYDPTPAPVAAAGGGGVSLTADQVAALAMIPGIAADVKAIKAAFNPPQ